MSDAELRHELDTEILGREIHFDYSETWVGYSLLGLRLVMGWTMFQAGIVKILDPDWTARGFLMGVPEGNPFPGVWASMAGNPLVDMLVMWGLTLTGIGLLLGAFVRWNAFWSAVMMMFFWAASLQGGLMAGLPLAHGWVVDDHLVYALLLFGLGAFGSGRILGLDSYIEDSEIVKNNKWLRYILG
ncbi:MAG: DoxX family membrane protein [Halobacteria archaeon]|nr:DoxX family membrane protein [Halobacteria archaeon]